ncbi:hypothetical protein QPK14_00225 [Photorhabdus temperata subsp. temperata]
MEKEYNLSTGQSNTENANPESIGPSSDELKNRFKAGSIPLQTDYSDLIDIADIGRRAVGKAPDQTNNPNSALELDNSSGLKVKTNPTGGISVDSSGIAVKCWPSGGITVTDGAGLYLKLVGGNSGNGWSGVSGLGLDSDGVKVKAGNGINVDGSGVSVKAKENNGINVDSSGVSVKAKAGSSIKVDSDGVSIDIQSIASELANLIIPPGTIVPFYGNYDNPPSGWVWCDGSNGTPDLNTNNNHHDSVDHINLISGSMGKNTNYWQLDYGTHVVANVYFMRYIMKKIS